MLRKQDCYYLGHISKVRGFKGEMLLFLDVDDPSAYNGLKNVLVDVQDQLQPFFIKEIHIDGQGYARTFFDGIDTRVAAAELAGKALYLPLHQLPALPADEYYLHELVGMEVVDAHLGKLGMVEQVLDFSNNPLIQVFRNGYEVLIPIQPLFVTKVDKKLQIVHVQVPSDLLEMNKI